MVISKFKIGDEVETTKEYRKSAEEINPLLTTTQITPYIRGKVTDIREQIDYKTENIYYTNGMIGTQNLYPQIERKWISVTVDGGKLLNQDCLQKVE